MLIQLGKIRPKLADVGKELRWRVLTRNRPKLIDAGRNLVEFGQRRENVGPKLASIDQCRSNLGRQH